MSQPAPTTPAPAPAANDTTSSSDAAHAARSGAVQVLTIAAQALTSVTHVLLARLFGAAVFGSYQTASAIVEMVTRAGTAGADKSMLRYIAAHRVRGEVELVRNALGTGLRLAIVSASVLAVALALGSSLVARIAHEPALATALPLMAPAAIFTGCTLVLVQASLAAKVMRANFVVRGVAEPVLLLCGGLLAALAGRGLFQLALAQTVAAAATLVLAVVAVGRILGPNGIVRSLRSPALPGFVSASVPIGAAELTNAILQRADIVMLAALVGPRAAAIYAAAEFITRVIGNARSAFDSVAAPIFSEALHLGQRERFRDNWRLMVRWVASAAAPIAVTVIALRHQLLSLYGPDFVVGGSALALLAIGHMINATFGLSGYVLVVGGWSRLLLANNIAAAGTNIVVGLTLIPRLGIVGSAVAALAGTLLLHVLVFVEVLLIHRLVPFGWSIVKPLIAALVVLVVETWLVSLPLPVAMRVTLVIVLGLLVYLSVLTALGLAPEDRRILVSARDRIRRWLGPRR